MPGRKAKPPRLWFREDEGIWVILDRGRHVRTGCLRDDTEGASRALKGYLTTRHAPTTGANNPASVSIADVLTAYERSKEPKPNDERGLKQHDLLLIRLLNLNLFFGAKTVGDIKGQLCRDFVDWCTGKPNENNKGITARTRHVSDQTARRALEDLRAAINDYHAEHKLSVVPVIVMPAKSEGRQRWLTRNEAARLLGAALGFVWDIERETWKRDERGHLVRRDRATRVRRRHTARFILMGIYTARREETIRRTQWFANTTHPWLDVETWVYHGRGADERKTKKRRPPAKVALRLRPHLARWRRKDIELAARLRAEEPPRIAGEIRFIVHRPDGRPIVEKIKTGWKGILADAGLGSDVVRHSLRHTAATWTMQNGTDLWQAAGWLAMTVEQLENNYGHHHPDFQEEAAGAFSKRR